MVMDDAWLAEPPKRSRLRMALVILLSVGLVFLAGVQVQKTYGVASSADGSAASLPAGFTLPGAQAFRAPDAAGQAPADQGADAAEDTTAVIGTVVSVEDGVWTVKDLGGKTHRITVGDDVRIVRESALTADEVGSGTTVDVSGSTDDQGQVTATTITVR